MMDDKARENVSLFNELREFSMRDIPAEVSAAAARHRDRIGADCFKPYDLLRYSNLAELPPLIKSHVEKCSSCRTLLLPRIDPDLVDHIVEAAAIAVAAASVRTFESTRWYLYPLRRASAALKIATTAPSYLWRKLRKVFGSSKPEVVDVPVPD